jgi:hypothetical protein
VGGNAAGILAASRLSGAGDCEQPVKASNPNVQNIDE